MTEKNYPTRMHEVLGVETGERFKIHCFDSDYFLTADGMMCEEYKSGKIYPVSGVCWESAINRGITRRPRLTEEQVRHLKGLYLLGFRWIERDEHDALVAWANYDDKADVFQNDFLPLSYRSYQVLIVVPTQNAPLNIVQTLRDAGVEVES